MNSNILDKTTIYNDKVDVNYIEEIQNTIFNDKYREKINEEKNKKKLKNNKKNYIVPLPINNFNKKIYEDNKKNVIKQGEKIYKDNDYISKIWDIMSDNTFSSFFDSYLNNYSDVQVAMVFFNLYKTIKEQYNQAFNKNITREEMVYMLRSIMRDNFMRKYFIQDANNKNIISLNTDIMIKDIRPILDVINISNECGIK